MRLKVKPGSGLPRLRCKDGFPPRPVNVLHVGTARVASRIPASARASLSISAPLALGHILCCLQCDCPHRLRNQGKRTRASQAGGTLSLKSREDELLPAALLPALPCCCGSSGNLLRLRGCPFPGCWPSPEHMSNPLELTDT